MTLFRGDGVTGSPLPARLETADDGAYVLRLWQGRTLFMGWPPKECARCHRMAALGEIVLSEHGQHQYLCVLCAREDA